MDKNLNVSISDSELDKNKPNHKVLRSAKRKRDDDVLAEELTKFKTEIQSMFSAFMKSQEKEMKKHTLTLKEIQQTNLNIENCIASLSSQNEEFQNRIQHLEETIKEDKKYITILEDKVEILQRDQRKSNFEIKNAPKKTNETKEDLISMTLNLANTTGCPMNKSDIKDVYRVQGKKDMIKNPPIIVETTSSILKNDLIKSCKIYNLKQKSKLSAVHLGLKSAEAGIIPIFVTEHLTAKAARLHFLARDLVKSMNYKYCWTAYGKIYVRKDDNSAIIQVINESQVQKLLTNIK